MANAKKEESESIMDKHYENLNYSQRDKQHMSRQIAVDLHKHYKGSRNMDKADFEDFKAVLHAKADGAAKEYYKQVNGGDLDSVYKGMDPAEAAAIKAAITGVEVENILEERSTKHDWTLDDMIQTHANKLNEQTQSHLTYHLKHVDPKDRLRQLDVVKGYIPKGQELSEDAINLNVDAAGALLFGHYKNQVTKQNIGRYKLTKRSGKANYNK